MEDAAGGRGERYRKAMARSAPFPPLLPPPGAKTGAIVCDSRMAMPAVTSVGKFHNVYVTNSVSYASYNPPIFNHQHAAQRAFPPSSLRSILGIPFIAHETDVGTKLHVQYKQHGRALPRRKCPCAQEDQTRACEGSPSFRVGPVWFGRDGAEMKSNEGTHRA